MLPRGHRILNALSSLYDCRVDEYGKDEKSNRERKHVTLNSVMSDKFDESSAKEAWKVCMAMYRNRLSLNSQ